MSSREIMEKLLNTLNKSIWGMTIEELAKNAQLHRNTVSKYLQKLEELGLAVKKTIGKYTVWLPINMYNYYKNDTGRYFLEAIISELQGIEEKCGKNVLIEQIGKNIARKLLPKAGGEVTIRNLENEAKTDILREFLDIYIPTVIPSLKVKIREFEFTDKMIIISLIGCPSETVEIENTCRFFKGYIEGTLQEMRLEYKSIEIIDYQKNSESLCRYAIILEKPIGEQIKKLTKKCHKGKR
ncbi:MAG: helix-turn-helix domain-containing protein [Candidatus Njordarchaeia archaeon]